MPAEVIGQTLAQVTLAGLKQHPKNPRQGDVGAISESIDANGFYGAVVAQKSTKFILAGNHRYLAAKAAGIKKIPVLWIDVDDDRAERIMLADNRLGDLATYDDPMLVEILRTLAEEESGLLGTGYSGDDLDEIARLSGVLGSEASAFLDDLADGADDHDAIPVASKDGTLYYSISYTVTAEQRAFIREGLGETKKALGFDKSVDALVALCKEAIPNG